MWAPRPEPPPAPGWWVELEFDRWAAGIAADVREAEQANEQAKRLRQLRRRIEKLDEQMCLAEGASEAREHFRRRGIPYDERRSVPRSRDDFLSAEPWRGLPVEHSTNFGRVLNVWK
jgi:hypothetical protein